MTICTGELRHKSNIYKRIGHNSVGELDEEEQEQKHI